MTKIVLALIGLFASLQLQAQNIDKSEIQEPNGSAINIAVSKFDLEDGNSFFEEAEDLERKGDYNEALTLFGKAAFEYNAIKNFNRYGQAVIKMSSMHYQLGRFTDAEQILLNVALKNYSKTGNRAGVMNTYNLLGKVYLANTKYTQSMWFYTQQGILAKQLKSNNSYIESILGIVQVKIKKKDFTLALRDLKSAEWLANSIKTTQYKTQIKDARETIASKTTNKKVNPS
ncbi:tetratricopeptide repeat protein [Pedobacter borealis]|uniref:tetratricopeptide repeat protein n=1 Tax=Pedobacter borealis TaxID=475254 RepID=UPI000493A523|nr:tetratricopeptide repeat protein [Pedobacter borealis]